MTPRQIGPSPSPQSGPQELPAERPSNRLGEYRGTSDALQDVVRAIYVESGVAPVVALTVIEALRSLPVERRMEAMGMTLYGEVTWDDEDARDVVVPVVDVAPGSFVYVESTWVEEGDRG